MLSRQIALTYLHSVRTSSTFRSLSTSSTTPHDQSKNRVQSFYDGKAPDKSKLSKRGNVDVKVDRIHFLGTGSAVPVPQCNVSSCVFSLSSGKSIMFDCGEGTQHQSIRSSRMSLTNISAICITHLHGDHFYGIFGILTAMNALNRTETLHIIGPPGIRSSINTVLRHSSCFLNYPRVFTEVPTNKSTIITDAMEDLGIEIRTVPLVHRVPTVGYVLQEKDGTPKVDAHRVFDLGGTTADIRNLRGGGTFTTASGEVLTKEDCILPPRKGLKYAFLQDTRDCSKARPDIDDCFLMIHEATHDASQKALAFKAYHSTTHGAAETAVTSNADNLILTHFSTRYAREPIEVVHDPTDSEPFRLSGRYVKPYSVDIMAQVVDHIVAPPRLVMCKNCGESMHPTVVDTKYLHLYSAWAEKQRTNRKKRLINGANSNDMSQNADVDMSHSNENELEEDELATELEIDSGSESCQHVCESQQPEFQENLRSFQAVVSDINTKNNQNMEAALKSPNNGHCCPSHSKEHFCQKSSDVPKKEVQTHSSQLSPDLDSNEPVPYLNSKARISLERISVLDLLEETKSKIAELRPNAPDSINVFNAADFRTFEIINDKVIQMPNAEVRINKY